MDKDNRFNYLHTKWKKEGLTEIEKEEFSDIIMERVADKEEEIKKELMRRTYDFHHQLPREARQPKTRGYC